MPPAPPLRRRSGRLSQQGAALLLLLAVAGVGAASLLVSALGGPRSDVARERQTLVAMGQAREALIGYALRYGRLPRPAVSATDGQESPLPCAAESSCTGFLPWVTLGINAQDGWGKLLRYSVSPDFTQSPIVVSEAVAGKRVLTRLDSGAPAYLAGQAQCSLLAQCVPAVLLSAGRYNLGTSPQGVAQSNGAQGNIDEIHNNSGANDFISRRASSDATRPGGEFDDLVTWVPLKLLYLRMSAAGQLR